MATLRIVSRNGDDTYPFDSGNTATLEFETAAERFQQQINDPSVWMYEAKANGQNEQIQRGQGSAADILAAVEQDSQVLVFPAIAGG